MNERIRVLHVAASLSTYGAERLVALLAERLPDDAFDVRVMTVYSPPATLRPSLARRVIDVARRGRWDAAFLPRMVRAVRAFAPDIVHTHTHNGKYWGRTAAALARVPAIVHTEHTGIYEREFLPAHLYNRLLHRFTDAFVGFSDDHVARIAAAEGIAPEKFTVIPNGIPASSASGERAAIRRALAIDDDRAIVLHAGRFEKLKRQELAIDAWHHSPELRRRAVLVFAGTGHLEKAARARAWGLGLEPDVRFLGYRNDVEALLGGVDLSLLTSDFEAMPLAAIEAMRAGVPVVTTPWAGAREFLDDGRLGGLAAGYEPAQIAAAILTTLDDARTPERAARAQERATTRYAVESCVEAHAALYRRLLAAPAAAASPAGAVASV